MEMKLLCLLAFVWSQIHGFPFFLVIIWILIPLVQCMIKKEERGLRKNPSHAKNIRNYQSKITTSECDFVHPL